MIPHTFRKWRCSRLHSILSWTPLVHVDPLPPMSPKFPAHAVPQPPLHHAEFALVSPGHIIVSMWYQEHIRGVSPKYHRECACCGRKQPPVRLHGLEHTSTLRECSHKFLHLCSQISFPLAALIRCALLSAQLSFCAGTGLLLINPSLFAGSFPMGCCEAVSHCYYCSCDSFPSLGSRMESICERLSLLCYNRSSTTVLCSCVGSLSVSC